MPSGQIAALVRPQGADEDHAPEQGGRDREAEVDVEGREQPGVVERRAQRAVAPAGDPHLELETEQRGAEDRGEDDLGPAVAGDPPLLGLAEAPAEDERGEEGRDQDQVEGQRRPGSRQEPVHGENCQGSSVPGRKPAAIGARDRRFAIAFSALRPQFSGVECGSRMVSRSGRGGFNRRSRSRRGSRGASRPVANRRSRGLRGPAVPLPGCCDRGRRSGGARG